MKRFSLLLKTSRLRKGSTVCVKKIIKTVGEGIAGAFPRCGRGVAGIMKNF